MEIVAAMLLLGLTLFCLLRHDGRVPTAMAKLRYRYRTSDPPADSKPRQQNPQQRHGNVSGGSVQMRRQLRKLTTCNILRSWSRRARCMSAFVTRLSWHGALH
ncbi:uncharacterized protein PITG_23139 [Phytophthora infestans T30-4]|uniref:Secreted RxLR effector peptide protein n=1 Tax=Phytophthora infestans (strain T30-4) TaxID=403677 RepID=D0NZ32_PHYIT|nr:uncharacterized protein PITG_23139 [Phytophthora infestans T30-4]EEY68819.1 conserved hypothetical protein [Phytophthora infestans T30-4]|eukprot:XP_002997369.1 conserved hypothetical protein [Phytophthora infestans T30-4]